jgi:hypothetical protein
VRISTKKLSVRISTKVVCVFLHKVFFRARIYVKKKESFTCQIYITFAAVTKDCRCHQTKPSMFSFVTIMYLAAKQKKYFVPGAAFELKQNQ